MHDESSGSKVNSVLCQCFIIVMMREIDWDGWFWSICID